MKCDRSSGGGGDGGDGGGVRDSESNVQHLLDHSGTARNGEEKKDRRERGGGPPLL